MDLQTSISLQKDALFLLVELSCWGNTVEYPQYVLWKNKVMPIC